MVTDHIKSHSAFGVADEERQSYCDAESTLGDSLKPAKISKISKISKGEGVAGCGAANRYFLRNVRSLISSPLLE